MSTLSDELTFWTAQERLQLVDGCNDTIIADGRRGLRTQDGRFVALSNGSAPLVDMLRVGCTGSELDAVLELPQDSSGALARKRVASFLEALCNARVLNIPPDPSTESAYLARFAKSDFFTRVPVWSNPAPTFLRLGHVLRSLLPPPVVLVLAVLVVVFGLSGLLALRFDLDPFPLWMLVFVPATMLIQVTLHETWHGVALGYLRLTVRSVGVGFLLNVFPTAYVDRTDAYRLKSRTSRAMVSLAGPLSDLVVFGALGVFVRIAPAGERGLFELLLIVTGTTIVVNLNPLFPSDGQQAIEAALGAVNTRARAFTFVSRRLRGAALPPWLVGTSRSAALGYWTYAVASAAYLAVIATGIGRALLALARLVFGPLR